MIRAGFVMTGFMVVAGCSTVVMPEAPPLRSQTSTTVGHPPLARRPAPVLHEEEERWRDRAALLMRDDRWADAALQWELLVLLRPDNSEYERALQDTRVRIAKLAAERQRRAEEARQRGDVEQAALWHFKTLVVDPDHVAAAQSLRALDRERLRRTYLARGARTQGSPNALAQILFPNGSPARPAVPAMKPAPAMSAPDDLDAGIMLYRQGELAASIEALHKHLQRSPQDVGARRYLGDAYTALAQRQLREGKEEPALALFEKAHREGDAADQAGTIRALRLSLAEEYYQRGVRTYHADLRQTIVLLERSLEFDPGHPQAALRLQQARASQRTLESIEKKKSRP